MCQTWSLIGNDASRELDTSFFVVIADLWSVDMTEEANLVVHPSASGVENSPGSCTRNLVGSIVASASKLIGTDNKLGVYFVFQDLSIRTEGPFRLKFSFANLAG
jgi:hypothetical protein